MDTIKRVSNQAGWQILGKVATAISTFIILAVVSRVYGTEGIGILTLSLAYITFFTVISDFGINALLLGNFLDNESTYVWQRLLGFRIILSFILICIGIIGVSIWNISIFIKTIVLLSIAPAIIQQAVFITSNIVFQARLRYDLSIISSSLGAFITLISLIVLLNFGSQIQELAWAYNLGWIVTALFSLLLVRNYVKKIFPIFDYRFILSILKNVWPISITLILNLAYFRIDAFILSQYKSLGDVGIYNLAYQFFQASLVLPAFIMNGYYPIMLKSYSQDRELFVIQIKNACLIMGTIAILVVLIFMVTAPFLIFITGGRGFEGSSLSLRILSLGFPAYFISSVLMWVFVTTKRFKTMLLIYFSGLVLNIALNLSLIPKFSYIASSWVTGISEYFILLLQLVILPRIVKK